MSQIGLALPIILLYEISILSARLIEKKRAEAAGVEEEDWDDDDDGDADADGGAVVKTPGDAGKDESA